LLSLQQVKPNCLRNGTNQCDNILQEKKNSTKVGVNNSTNTSSAVYLPIAKEKSNKESEPDKGDEYSVIKSDKEESCVKESGEDKRGECPSFLFLSPLSAL